PSEGSTVAFSAVDRADFSRNGRWLARSTQTGQVELWDVARLRAGSGLDARVVASPMPAARWDQAGRPEAAEGGLALDDGRIVTSTGTELQLWSSGSLQHQLSFHAERVRLGADGRTVWGVRRKRTL